ncbi:hypothetical protein ACN47E_003734 [Coniothyrium glycines]
MSLKSFILALAAVACASPLEPIAKATSDDPCEPCQPQGASGTRPPAVGSDLSSLYINVLASVKGISFGSSKRTVVDRDSGFCCRKSLDCVNVQSLNVPICYDKFTTNFIFPDGSYGSLTTGEYTSDGANVNLVSGDYTQGDQKGNIYSSDPSAKPNTATLSIPPQFTGTGVGGAIPVTELGSIIVYTTTIPGTTFTAPTTVPQTVKVATVGGVTVYTTISPATISAPTTIAPLTSVVTQTANAAVSTESSTAGAGQISVDSTRSFGMSIVGAVVYALYAL